MPKVENVTVRTPDVMRDPVIIDDPALKNVVQLLKADCVEQYLSHPDTAEGEEESDSSP